jgi:hypothetical protein
MAKEFWIINHSSSDISLDDLNYTIKSRKIVNLLDKRHFDITEDQILQSITSGCIYRRRDKIKIRVSGPEVKKDEPNISNNPLIDRSRSVYEQKTQYFDELKVDDLEFIEANIES